MGRSGGCLPGVASLPLLLVATLAAIEPARAAEQPTGTQLAAAQDVEARDLFQRGEFDKAASSFLAAYAAQPLPGFLHEAAVCFDRADNRGEAARHFERYLSLVPQSEDRAALTERIALLRGAGPGGPGTAPLRPEERRRALLRGLVLLESSAPEATVRIDEPTGPALRLPWNGRLAPGPHTLFVSAPGHRPDRQTLDVPAQPAFLHQLFTLSDDASLVTLTVESNIDDALVFVDGATVAAGRPHQPLSLSGGKHHLAVSRDGYITAEVDIELDGKVERVASVTVELTRKPVAYLILRSIETLPSVEVQCDHTPVCTSLPCRLELAKGTHLVEVASPGMRPYWQSVRIEPLTEATLTVALADQPSPAPAVGYFVGGAAFAALGAVGGVYLGSRTAELFRASDRASLTSASYFVLGGALAAVFTYLGAREIFRDKGEPSTGKLKSRRLAWYPFGGDGHGGSQPVILGFSWW